MSFEILTNQQMAQADQLTIDSGVPGYELMKNAGQAAVDIICDLFGPGTVKIFCGPGNNGGDGFVIANLLRLKKWDVSVFCLIPVSDLKGDALEAASHWGGPVKDFSDVSIGSGDIVIDAVFGTGFSRDFDKKTLHLFKLIDEQKPDIVSIDIPSGVNGSSGHVAAYSPKAKYCITFCRKKIGHILMPGAAHCGKIFVCDIGIPDSLVNKAGFTCIENNQDIWNKYLVSKPLEGNKYNSGHTIILGGPCLTGASCMAASAAIRIGSGLCTIVGHEDVADVYRSYSPNIMIETWSKYNQFKSFIEDPRRNTVLIGPGAGLNDLKGLRQAVIDACSFGQKKVCVLDADVFSAFKTDYDSFYDITHLSCILTPHEGEFCRIFPGLEGNKIERCMLAAKLSGAIVLLKGADTTICSPTGDAIVNTNAPSSLATGGSGDVLAGIIAGLSARGTPPFEAACAGAWIHGEAANLFGPGLTALDIIDKIPDVLSKFS